MYHTSKTKFFLPLVLSTLGGIFVFMPELFAQDVAPYAFGSLTAEDPLVLVNLQEKFLKRRIRIAPQGGLDLAGLAGVYVYKSHLTGDLSYMDRAEGAATVSLVKSPYYNFGAQLVQVQVAEARHQFAVAIAKGKALAEIKRKDAGIISSLVSANLGYGQPAEALRYANDLVEILPHMESFALRALSLIAVGKNSEALQDFNQALKVEGPGRIEQSAWVRTLIARHYLQNGDRPAAKAYVDSALKVNPYYHVGLAQKAELQALKGNISYAKKLYADAFKQRGEPPYLLALAKLHELSDEPQLAKRRRQQAEESVRLEIETTPYGHYNELSQILIDKNRPQDFGELISAAQRDVEQRGTSGSYLLLAQAYAHVGIKNEAKKYLAKAMSFGETNTEYQALLTLLEKNNN